MTSSKKPGHFGANSPKYVYGRENLDYDESKNKAKSISEEVAESASSDFHRGNSHSDGVEGYEEVFMGGSGNVFDDEGWNIAGTQGGDEEPLGTDALDDIDRDLDPTVEGSTAWLVEHTEGAWEKYDAIASSPFFSEVNRSIVAHKEAHDEHNDNFKDATKKLDKAVELGEEFNGAESIYDEAQEALKHFEAFDALRMRREGYLNMVATSLNGATEADMEGMTVSDDELGISDSGLHSVGYAETGTREWLEMRQDSLGGSDMGTLADKSFFANESKDKIWESKIKEISDEEVEAQRNSHDGEIKDAPARGNAMEDVIGALYAHQTGLNIVHNKSTWKTEDGSQHINFDFAEHDENGDFVGPVEIKNVNDGRKWGNPSEGLDGVPSNYRAQALQQALHSNASKVTVVAMMGGETMKAYSEPMTDELREEARKLASTAPSYMEKAREARRKYQETGVLPPRPDAWNGKSRKGIPKMATKTKKISGDKARLMSKMAVMGSTDTEEIAKRFVDAMGTTDTKEWTQGKQEEAFKKVYGTLTPHGSFNGVDIETNAMGPTQGSIIEFGGVAYNMDSGEESNRLGELYKPEGRFSETKGTGASDVHNITPEMVADKGEFSSEDNQKRLLEYLSSNGPIVSHNAKFEKGWFRAHVKGFAEEEAKGNIRFVDTIDIVQHTMDTDRNTLQSFVGGYGISEEEYKSRAHRATDDTEMMMEAFVRWSKDDSRRQ